MPESEPAAPPVVAVVVTCDPGPWLETALASLAGQDYPNLSVLVVDAGSRVDPAERVAAVLPDAFMRRLDRRGGFGIAANEVLKVVEGASHYLLCHDDVALDPSATRLMVEEAYRSNAGIVCPKVVDWDHPDRLLAVGASVDLAGVVRSRVEPGELDQEQHDAVRDVFVAPSCATLVRADLFSALGGFDEQIDSFGEDLDLCWRALVAGARVVVAPAARVRHRQATLRGERAGWGSAGARRRAAALVEEHRVRTVLRCASGRSLGWLLPVLVSFAFADAALRFGQGRAGEAMRLLLGVARGFARPLTLLRERRTVQRGRLVSDRDLRRLQSRGDARLRQPLRLDGAVAGLEQPPLEVAPTAGSREAWRLALGAAALILVIWAIGTRSLLGHELPEVGRLPDTSAGWAALWRSWWSTWQGGFLGSASPSSPALALLGVGATVLFGAVGTLQHLAVLGPLVIGPLGAYRAARWWGSRRGQVAAMVLYAAVPVPYDALAEGHWAGLVAFGAAPWVIGHLGRLSGELPYPKTPLRQVAWRVVGLGLLVAVAASVAPAFIYVVAAVGVALLAGSALAGRPRSGLRMAALAVASAVVAAILLLPWSAGALIHRATAFGVAPGPAGRLGLSAVLRFDAGPFGAGPLGWAFLVAAALPLLIGRSWRLAWASRLWMVALACLGLAWAGSNGWVPSPDPEVVLAPAAAALAASTAIGVVAFELDLPGYRFGWRQLTAGIATLAVVVAVIPFAAAARSGRWDLPSAGPGSALGFLPSPRAGDYRVLWVGAPGALPLAGRELSPGVAYATSFDGMPGAADQFLPASRGASGLLAADLRLAEGRLTTHLGHLLAPMAVRYIVVPNHDGPAGSGARSFPVPEPLLAGLQLQTDLQAVNVDPDYSVYRNAAWAPARALLPRAALGAESATGLAADRLLETSSLAGAKPVLQGGSLRSSGPVPAGATVFVSASKSPWWRLTVAGRSLKPRPAFGWAMSFAVPVSHGGQASLSPGTSLIDRAGQLGEVVLWGLVITGLLLDRRRRRARGPEVTKPEWFEAMAPRPGRLRPRASVTGLGSEDLQGDEVWIDV